VTNWTDLSSSSPSLFFSGDNVLLDDTATLPDLTIAAGVSVYPATITNNSDGTAFSISGDGKISGPANIVKLGASTLTIATGNDFTGTVDIQNGVLKASTGTALGSPATGTTVEPGGTLDIGGQSLGGEVITIAGDGFNSQGALINSGGVQGTALRSLILSSNASVGGSGQFSINNSGGAGSLSSQGQPFKLTKVGANQFGLQNLTTVDPALGDIEVQQGILEFNGQTPNMGDPLHTNTVDAGATLQFASSSVVWNKFFNLNGNGTTTTVNNGTAAVTELAGPVELHGGVVFNVSGNLLTISSVISGDGSLTKNGTTPMVLSNNNTYTGDTMINAGALRLAGDGSFSNSPNLIIASGATLTVTGRVDTTFTLLNNQTVSGNGVINGQLVTLSGSTVSPGLSGIGGLTVSNAVTLGGTTLMELNLDAATNDVVNVNSSITYGGILSLANIGTTALTNGASFKLFKALSYGGTFASIQPAAPGDNLAWNTSALSSGIISVVGSGTGPTTNANITTVKLTGTNIVLHGVNNNVPNTSFKYVVLSSPSLTVPLSSWTPVLTNTFNSDGTFDSTVPVVPGTPRLFYDVKVMQ
jgi:autotransporter-associated beta strand protein